MEVWGSLGMHILKKERTKDNTANAKMQIS